MSMDTVGMGGIAPVSATTLAPPVVSEAPQHVQAAAVSDTPPQVQATAGVPEDDSRKIQQMVDQIQEHLQMMNVSLRFSTYGEHDEKIAIIVVNKETGEVIREIPSKEIRNLYSKVSDLTGMIFNAEI